MRRVEIRSCVGCSKLFGTVPVLAAFHMEGGKKEWLREKKKEIDLSRSDIDLKRNKKILGRIAPKQKYGKKETNLEPENCSWWWWW